MSIDRHRLAEARNLELHRLVAGELARHPERLQEARQTLAHWRALGSVDARYLDAWADLLELPLEELLRVIVDPGERMVAMRQVSPFAGFVDPRTRWRIWDQVAEALSS